MRKQNLIGFFIFPLERSNEFLLGIAFRLETIIIRPVFARPLSNQQCHHSKPGKEMKLICLFRTKSQERHKFTEITSFFLLLDFSKYAWARQHCLNAKSVAISPQWVDADQCSRFVCPTPPWSTQRIASLFPERLFIPCGSSAALRFTSSPKQGLYVSYT